MHKRWLSLFTVLLFCISASCAHNKIERIERPADDLQATVIRNDIAVVRTPYAVLTLRNIRESEWESLLSNKKLGFASETKETFRVPKLLFFIVTLTNMTSYPLFLSGADVIYGENKFPSLTENDLQQRLISASYKTFNFKEILSFRRLLYGNAYFASDFIEDTINYKLDFILPDDTVVTILPFEYPPAALLNYKLEFRLRSSGVERKLNININRNEYRINDPDFKRTPGIGEDFPL